MTDGVADDRIDERAARLLADGGEVRAVASEPAPSPTRAGTPTPGDPIRAARRGELELQFQPIVDAGTGGIAAFEALLRWQHPLLGNLAASEFAPAIERCPQAEALDRWILGAACQAAACWPSSVCVAVNIYPPRLAKRSFVDDVRQALQASGLEPARLSIELVERASILCHPSVTDHLVALLEIGVTFALDDFLTGESTIEDLSDVPAATVKIDRSSVDPLNHGDASPTAAAIVEAAHDSGLQVVAEGIETEAGEAAAIHLGCDLLQGFLYSPAVPAPQTFDLLRDLGPHPDAPPGAPRRAR